MKPVLFLIAKKKRVREKRFHTKFTKKEERKEKIPSFL
jgi:hypothetical protein